MSVTWSELYFIGAQEEHILPCDEDFVILYDQPRCVGPDDKIRIYEKVYSTSSAAGPASLSYITEHRAEKGGTTVRFKCDIFEDTIAEYCFKYVSRARSGLLHEHYTLCLPTKYNPGNGYFLLVL